MTTSSLIFVDARVSDYAQLMAHLPTTAEVVVLDSTTDGLQQMADYLAGRTGIEAIHVVSHGSQGALYLGNTRVDGDYLTGHSAQLASIGSSLTESGDILLYGCNVAQGDVGLQFVQSWANLTEADVIASNDATGGTLTTGNLNLEVFTGSITSELLIPSSYPYLLADNTPPSLTSLAFPTSIDISTGASSATFTAQASDEGSGIKDVVVWFDKDLTYQIGTYKLWGLFNGWTDSTPNEASSTWSVSQYNNPGTYNITKVDVTDLAGNKQSYTPAELENLGILTSFTVAGITSDTTLPTLTSLTFPTSIDISTGASSATFTAQASDEGSGIKDVVVWFDKDLTYQIGTYKLWGLFNGWTDSTPNEASSTWSVSQYNNPGTYNITKVDVTDLAGNKRSYTPAELTSLGIHNSFIVTDGSPTPTNGITIVGSRTGDFIDLKISAATWSENSNSISFKLDYDTTDVQWVSANPGSTGTYTLSTSATATGSQGIVRISGSISNGGDNTEFLHLRFSLVPGATTPFDYSFTNVNVNDQGLSPIMGSFSFENTNSAPIGWVTISGTTTQGQTLTVANTLADVDGLGTVSYQWKANGTAITGATGSTYTLGQADVGKTISVTASYTDGQGTAEAVTSAGTTAVANVNDTPTGAVTLSGTATQGQTLTAANTLTDVDGLGTISYQWKANGTAITGATGTTYTLGQADVGKTISVTASYTDGQGTVEAVTSSDTAAVTAAVNTITGNSSNNVLLSTVGNDAIDGGAGTDTVSYANATAAVNVTLASNTEQNTGGAGIDTLLNIENLTGSKYNDKLTGNAAANVLNGGAGADTMTGGNGNDTYYVNHASDLVNEALAGGTDTVYSTLLAYTLRANVEKGVVQGTVAGNLTGNALANTLTGNATANRLTGGAGNDTLQGNGGNDILIGGAGKDVLTGGAGNDVFDFNTVAESGLTATTRDVITDFVRGQDKIDLSTIDANTALTGNQAFTGLIGANVAFTKAGQLRLNAGVLYGNTDADATAEFSIALTGITTLANTDFVL